MFRFHRFFQLLRPILSAVIGGLLVYGVLVSTAQIRGADKTRFGAVLIRARLANADSPEATTIPEVVFSANDTAANWRIVEGDAWTGVDRHRFYFTIESDQANAAAPQVEIIWPDVEIAKVYGHSDGFKKTEQGVTFKMSASRAPMGVFTEIPFGAVRLGVFHNWDVRVAGPYRSIAYPESEIKAQLNYMIGSLEVCRAYGWTETTEPDFVDHINIYGFETCFPNGHQDFPPHFHIMLAWDGWKAANVAHYILDDQGMILKNNFWILHKNEDIFYKRGDVCPFEDKTGNVIFENQILPDGSGLVFRRIGADKEYLIHGGKNGATESVDIAFRKVSDNENSEWVFLCNCRANDDAINGVFNAVSEYADGTRQEISFKYDPDTGQKTD